jgi:hypothetical protein
MIIPGGMTSQLQVLDVVVNKPFKDHLKRQYSNSAVNLLTSADPHWITTGSRGPLSHFYDLNLKTIHKKYTNNTQQTNAQIMKYFI